jgi:thymidylate kinase
MSKKLMKYFSLIHNNYIVVVMFVGRKIIAISGISGSGKTTISSKLAIIFNATHIDQDSYYIKEKPKVLLSNGVMTSNWDCFKSLDLVQMNKDLRIPGLVIISGFALSDAVFEDDNKPDVHIHLIIPKELSLETRLVVKNFKNDKIGHDALVFNQTLVFNELVYPFYQKIVNESTIHKTIDCCTSNNRKLLDTILDEIIEYLKSHKSCKILFT